MLLAGIQRQRQAGSTQQPAPCCLATSARSCFIGVVMANARSKEQRRAVGSARLRCTPRRWCCWLASSGSGRQAARMQWFQAAPAHWRGSELLLYVSLAHGQQHRHQTSAATTAAAEEHRTPLTEGLHVRVSLRQCWAAIGKRKIRDYQFFVFQ